jgi:protein SCO1/2
MKGTRALGATLLLCAGGCLAQFPAPFEGVDQRIDAPLPLDLPFTDSEGRTGPLRAQFVGRPVLLVIGYYRCPQLCGVLMHGLLEALQRAALPSASFRLLRISIDPSETPADARAQGSADRAYAQFLAPEAAAPDLQFLTGPSASTQALAAQVGYRYRRTDTEGWTHPAVVIVATPQGRISRYLNGVRFEPDELRQALADARQGRSGGFTDRIALLCARFDPRPGRHTGVVMRGLQVTGALTLLALAVLWWRIKLPEA